MGDEDKKISEGAKEYIKNRKVMSEEFAGPLHARWAKEDLGPVFMNREKKGKGKAKKK